MTVSNGGLVDTQNNRVRMNEGPYANSSNTNVQAVINLNSGGILRTNRIRVIATAGYSDYINFNGGILRAADVPVAPGPALITQSGNDYISGVFSTFIYSGGGTIDNAGFSFPIAAPFLFADRSGRQLDWPDRRRFRLHRAPAVVLSGGTGVGATAVANVDPATGKVTGITVTGRGSGYSVGDVLTATLMGGGATTPATVGAINLTANTSGGMTFTGSGTTTLANVSTYTGPTLVTGGGTLELGEAIAALPNTTSADVNASSGITLGTAGSAGSLAQNSAVAVSTPVTIVNGTLRGNGTVNTVTVNSGATNSIVANNTTGGSLLTIGSLSLSGTAALNLTTSPPTSSTPVLPVTTLTASGPANSVTINAVNTSGGWASGTYQMVSYAGSLGGTGFPAFTVALSRFGHRQTASLTNPAGLIDLVIAGDSAIWTGKLNGDWTTNVQASPKNWALSTSLAATDYVSGDAVVFDDSATGATNINISTANVTPALATFNNSTLSYTVGSTGGFVIGGTGGMILNGTGSVTLNTANTFSGGVIVNAGTLNLGGTANATSSPVGTGRLSIGQSVMFDNTSGAAMTLPNNPLTITGDINFGGSNDLNFGNGAVTMTTPGIGALVNATTANIPAKTLTINGPITNTVANGLNKIGAGTLSLGGGGTFVNTSFVRDGILRVTNGTLNFSGPVQTGAVPFFTTLNVAYDAGTQAHVFVTGGTLNATGEIWFGSTENSYGSMTVTGGTVSTGSWLALARQSGTPNANTGIGLINVAGGTVTTGSNRITIGSFGNPTGRGIINVSSGNLNTTGAAGIYVGENVPGFLNVWGNGTTQGNVTIANSSNIGLEIAVNGGAGISVLNLGRIGGGTTNNGRITTPDVNGGGGTEIFNWHGGTLRSQCQLPGWQLHVRVESSLYLERRRRFRQPGKYQRYFTEPVGSDQRHRHGRGCERRWHGHRFDGQR